MFEWFHLCRCYRYYYVYGILRGILYTVYKCDAKTERTKYREQCVVFLMSAKYPYHAGTISGFLSIKCFKRTADFIKQVFSVYTHSMTTIYLSLSAQAAISTFFKKSPVSHQLLFKKMNYILFKLYLISLFSYQNPEGV